MTNETANKKTTGITPSYLLVFCSLAWLAINAANLDTLRSSILACVVLAVFIYTASRIVKANYTLVPRGPKFLTNVPSSMRSSKIEFLLYNLNWSILATFPVVLFFSACGLNEITLISGTFTLLLVVVSLSILAPYYTVTLMKYNKHIS